MKRLLMMFVILVMSVAVVSAQEPLEPDTPVRGEITNEAFEVEYTFSGTADSVVVIEMLAEDEDGFTNDLTAQVIILDSSGSVVIDTAENFVFSDAVLVTVLPADDDYTLLASRENGRSGDTEGEYTLQLIVPQVLGVGDSVESTASSENNAEYYVVNADSDYILRYNKSAGDYDPEINISTIDDNNSDFEDYALASGQLDTVAMGNIEAGIYVVRIQEAFFSFYFDEVTADYSLSVIAAE